MVCFIQLYFIKKDLNKIELSIEGCYVCWKRKRIEIFTGTDKNLMIILCGSALSFMENKVLSEKSPLFGRRDSQIKLEAFNYRESSLFVPKYSSEDKAVCYGITGGVAKYLSMIDGDKSLDDNIKRLFFHTDGYLYDETRNLLTQEFSDITLVNNIIEQIASGENTVNIIAGKVREKEPTVLYSLEKLIRVGLVEKVHH